MTLRLVKGVVGATGAATGAAKAAPCQEASMYYLEIIKQTVSSYIELP